MLSPPTAPTWQRLGRGGLAAALRSEVVAPAVGPTHGTTRQVPRLASPPWDLPWPSRFLGDFTRGFMGIQITLASCDRHNSQRSVEASPQNRPEVTSEAASEVGRSASFGLKQVLNVAEAQPAMCDSSGTRFPVRSSAVLLRCSTFAEVFQMFSCRPTREQSRANLVDINSKGSLMVIQMDSSKRQWGFIVIVHIADWLRSREKPPRLFWWMYGQVGLVGWWFTCTALKCSDYILKINHRLAISIGYHHLFKLTNLYIPILMNDFLY